MPQSGIMKVSVKNKFFTKRINSLCKYCACGPKFAGYEERHGYLSGKLYH
jgi:hypothetical protein